MWAYTLSSLAAAFIATVVCKNIIRAAVTTSSPPSEALNPFPWRTRIILKFLSIATDSCRRRNGTINRRFLSLFEFRSPARAGRFVSSVDHTVDESRKLWIRVFTPNEESPPEKKKLPVIFFFHGGGFAFLSADSFAYDAVCRKFATTVPAIVVSVNYRLSPEHKFPSQYNDGFDALAFIENDGLLGKNADLSRCFLAGDSAGANLAHHVAVRVCKGQNRLERVRVKGVISIQPFFGGEERTEAEIRLSHAPVVNVERTDWMWRAFLPEGVSRDHPAANVCGPQGEDISGIRDYPKTMVVIGGKDPLQDWQRRYYTWLVAAGKEAVLLEYPDAIHAFYIFPEIPQSKQLLVQIKDFIKSD